MSKYTWSQMTAHPVAHHTTPGDPFQMPLCGARIDIRTQYLADTCHGLELCARCATRQRANQRRVESAAARFLAETERFPVEPTDKNLRRAFSNVVKPIKPELYPAVRDLVTTIRAQRAAQENPDA